MTELGPKIHEASLQLLKSIGIRLESDDARLLLATAGVRVDETLKRVYPTEKNLEQAFRTVPRVYRVYGRNDTDPLVIGGPEVYIKSGGASLRVLTLDGQYEAATWEHLRQFNILLDGLPHVHMLLNQVDPQGDVVPGYYRRIAAEMFIGASKPVCLQIGDSSDLEVFLEMAAMIRGSRQGLTDKPLFITGCNAEPPLRIGCKEAEILVAASRAGVPCGIGDYVMMGITAPRTLAGALTQRHAVQLAALLLSQIARPGAPFYYAGSSGSADMRTLNPVMADPLALQILQYSVMLGRQCQLPVTGLATTDSRLPDAQAAAEMTATLWTAIQAGAHLIQGPTSMMDQMMLSSFIQAVIDNDIAGYLLAAWKAPEISQDTLALDAIQDSVSSLDPALKDQFYLNPHTIRHLRDGSWDPQVFAYESFNSWNVAGRRTLMERAREKAEQILRCHKPQPLDPALAEEVRRLARHSP
jgi:trimethylamine--corrinoid protein Co-methyltransferase